MTSGGNNQSQYFNQQAAALAAQVAQAAAQLEFTRMRFQQLELPQYQGMSALDKEKLAFQKATQVWTQAMQEASTTGSYNGVPAAQYLLSAGQMTGQFYQPGTLNPTQQAQYQGLQQQIQGFQQQLMTLAPGSPEYATAQQSLAAAYTQMAPLQQILQGTNNAPIPTMAGQNQQFQQQMALAGLTGIVPTGTTPWQMPRPTAPAGDQSVPGAGGGGAPVSIDEGLPAPAALPQSEYGWWHTLGNPARQQYIDGTIPLPGTTPVTEGAPGGMAGPGGVAAAGAGAAGGAAGGTPTMAYLQMLASLTGQFNGEPTPEYQQMLAALTGTFQGQPTQAAKQFAQQFGLSEAAVTGMYNGQPTQAAQEFAKQFGLSEAAVTGLYNGSPTQAAKEFAENLAFQREQFARTSGFTEAGITGYYNGQDTLARTQMENTQANQLLQLAASLRGPKNAFQFARVLGGTPGGLSDVLSAVSGRYNLPGFQGGGAAPEAVNLGNFMQDVYAATPAGGGAWISGSGAAQEPMSMGGAVGMYRPQMNQWGSPAPAYTVNPPGAQAPTNSFNYQPTGDGSQTVYPPGISAPVQAGQVSSATPLSGMNLQQIGAQQMAAQPYQLPRPSQWNAESYNNLGAYRQDLLGAQYEAAGWDPQAAIDQFKMSLPKYSGPRTATIAGIA